MGTISGCSERHKHVESWSCMNGGKEMQAKSRRFIVGMACLLLGHTIAAQPVNDHALPQGVSLLGPVVLDSSSRYRFESARVGKPFLIEVVTIRSPLVPPDSNARLPVVFVTDNDAFSTMVPAIARSASLELLPSMIVVGIGYVPSESANPMQAMIDFGVRRAVDFTPSEDAEYLAQIAGAYTTMGWGWPEGESLGQADTFLAFIQDELKPFIADRHPVDLDNAALLGHSLGGLFALHVLFTAPESFSRYLVLSPAAHYGGDILFAEEAMLGDAASAQVFMAMGERDVPQIVEATPRLDAQLRARGRPGLRHTFRIFEGENHTSVVPAGVMSGLRALFDPPAQPVPIPPE